MHREFGVIGVYANLIDRTVKVEFTLNPDPKTASLDSIVLCDKETGRILQANFSVKQKIVTMHLQEWPVAQKEYLLRIQSGIRSIVDDELPDSLQRVIVFKSEVLSTVSILSPAQHEVLNNLHIAWEEISTNGSEEGLVSSFYLEVAKENAFYNIVRSSEIKGRSEIELNGLESGQYFLRVRAQKNKEYGRWSETIAFIIKNKEVVDDVLDEPEYEEPLLILSAPKNGETKESFIFVFDEEIDIEKLPDILLTRRSI